MKCFFRLDIFANFCYKYGLFVENLFSLSICSGFKYGNLFFIDLSIN